jgi:hypothetical protein
MPANIDGKDVTDALLSFFLGWSNTGAGPRAIKSSLSGPQASPEFPIN